MTHGSYFGVLFDMDGVIADTEPSVTSFWNRIAAQYGVTLLPDDFKRHVYGVPDEHTLDVLFSKLTSEERARVRAVMQEHETVDTYSPVSGVVPFIRSLHEAGVPMAVVTSGMSWKVDVVLAQLGLADVLTTRVTAADIAAGKPDPACYLLGARFLGLPPEQCLVFEDAVSGVEAAVAAGATCIGVADTERAGRLLEAGATRVISDFECVDYSHGTVDLGDGRPVLELRRSDVCR
jgi:HAD superfamily hydrolase (TIGR01509 family)